MALDRINDGAYTLVLNHPSGKLESYELGAALFSRRS